MANICIEHLVHRSLWLWETRLGTGVWCIGLSVGPSRRLKWWICFNLHLILLFAYTTLQVYFQIFSFRKCQTLSHWGNYLKTLWDSQWNHEMMWHPDVSCAWNEGCYQALKCYHTTFPHTGGAQPEETFEDTVIFLQQRQTRSFSYVLK